MSARLLDRLTRHRLLTCLCVLAGLLALDVGVRSASAQRPDSLATEMAARRDAPPAPQVERKSPRRAVLYSLGGTVVPTAVGVSTGDDGVGAVLAALGLGLGPSVGHFYADNGEQAVLGIGLRVGGSAIGALGFLSAVEASLQGNSGVGGGGILVLLGGGTALISMGYDVFTAGDAAREYNEAHGLNTQVTPTVGPRGEQVGLALRVSF